ncbi:cobalamin-dependent protein [Methanomassiliicoccus luminyensis]|uniref:cobalamin-dependent protein n=1 Tax=Methanomassiliicoccus luminyensis TaxID=1080712 RepID=UPI000372FC8E|nr:cobalamin-dependent protein [Methanomassiliicoccus luminyensis]
MTRHLGLLAEEMLEMRTKDPERYRRLINEGMLAELGYNASNRSSKQASIDDIRNKHRPREASYAAISDAVISGKRQRVKELVEASLKQGKDPVNLVTNALMPGIQTLCELYDQGKAFVPEILMSNDAMLGGISLCQDKLGDVPRKGKVATFVAEGDLHDIGKNIVVAILRANGFEVMDLGRDVPVAKVVAAAKEHGLDMISGSTLMSTTKSGLKRTAETLEEEGIRAPIACGGAAVSKNFVETFGHAIYGRSPLDAVKIATEVCSGKDWKEVREKLR